MHPLIKIILLLVAFQAIQFAYLAWHAHELHGTEKLKYFLKLMPLGLCVIFIALLVLRLIGVPFFFFV